MSDSTGRALQILARETGGKQDFVVQDALEELQIDDSKLLDRDLVVIAAFGLYRKGKSYFLGLLKRYLTAQGAPGWMEAGDNLQSFRFQHCSQRITEGIWMWSKPFPIGDNKVVILLDTEGIYDEHATEKSMLQVFAMSALVSSLLIYNVHETITMQTMHEVQKFAEMGRQASSAQNSTPFQSIKFLVRDFLYPDKEHPYGSEGGQKYLEHWLKSSEADGVRSSLNACFGENSAFLLPKPSDEVQKGGPNANKTKEMGEEFVHHVKELVKSIFDNSNPRSSGGAVLKLKHFKNNVRNVAMAMRNSGIEPKSMFQAQVEVSNINARQRAVDNYRCAMENEMLEAGDKPIENFAALHKRLMREALQCFDEAPKVGGAGIFTKYRQEVEKEVSKESRHWNIENARRETRQRDLSEKEKLAKEMEIKMEELKLQHAEALERLGIERKEMELRLGNELEKIKSKAAEVQKDLEAKMKKLEMQHEKEMAEFREQAMQQKDLSDHEYNVKMMEIQQAHKKAMYELKMKHEENMRSSSKSDDDCCIL